MNKLFLIYPLRWYHHLFFLKYDLGFWNTILIIFNFISYCNIFFITSRFHFVNFGCIIWSSFSATFQGNSYNHALCDINLHMTTLCLVYSFWFMLLLQTVFKVKNIFLTSAAQLSAGTGHCESKSVAVIHLKETLPAWKLHNSSQQHYCVLISTLRILSVPPELLRSLFVWNFTSILGCKKIIQIHYNLKPQYLHIWYYFCSSGKRPRAVWEDPITAVRGALLKKNDV